MPKLKLAVRKEPGRLDASDNALVSFETLESLYKLKLDALNRDYLDGCLEYVAKARPELLREAHQAERELDRMWLDASQGRATMKDFETALEAWHRAYLACFEAYNKRPTKTAETGRLF